MHNFSCSFSGYFAGHKTLDDVRLTVNSVEMMALTSVYGSGEPAMLRTVSGITGGDKKSCQAAKQP